MQSIHLRADHGVSLHCTIWEPEQEPKGIVQIIHGVAEHTERYDTFARFLNQHGYLVVGEDHPGHGKTADVDSLGYMTGGWLHVVKCIHLLYETMHDKSPDLPYYMLGHSMGSFLLRTYLFTYHTPLAGAVISGTGWQPAVILPLGLLVCREEAARLGEKSHSPLLETMMFGSYNSKFKPNRTTHDWLCTDNTVVYAYIADPTCGFSGSIQLATEMLKGLRMIQDRGNLNRMQKDLPIYFLSGSDDPVGDMSKGVDRCIEEFRSAGMQNITRKIYPGMRHEPLNEIGKEQVFSDLLDWIKTV